MQLSLDAPERRFQVEVREFLRETLTPELRRAQSGLTATMVPPEVTRDWVRLLNAKGWAAPLWPKEHGGTGWSSVFRYIFERECAEADAPVLFPQGVRHVGPLLIKFGSPDQQAYFLPRILTGDDYWCQGYSEPQAGSDLARLSTRAVRDGDHYVITGSKIWTTDAQFANWMFVLVRTSTEPRRQQGISVLLVPMDSPGLQVQPIISISGHHELNQVFLDEVRVPVSNLVGGEGDGWGYGKYVLEFERGGSFAAPRLRRLLELTVRDRRSGWSPDPARLAALEIDIDTLEMMELRVATGLSPGENPGQKASILKLRSSLIRQELSKLGLEAAGDNALEWALQDEARSPATTRHLTYRAYTIFAGTSEIQRDIIASLAPS